MRPVDQFFQSLVSLPSMPKVVQEILALLNSDEIVISDVSAKINHDAVIAAKVLRMANSSYYGATRSIKTVDDAIAMIGLNKLHTLVVASGITGMFTLIPGLDLRKFWRHSLVTASVSRELAQHFGYDPELAYISGLIHNIGTLLIHLVFPEASEKVDAVCQGASVEERRVVEHNTIGLDHCEIGEELAKRWNFPDEIQRVIRYYATPLEPQATELAPIVYMAAHIAFCLEHREEAKHIAETLNPAVSNKLGIDKIEWIDRIEGYRGFVAEAEAYI